MDQAQMEAAQKMMQQHLWALYAFNAGLLVLKMFILAFSTGVVRSMKKVTPNPEDARAMGTQSSSKADPDVERVRRAHLNDLENIPVFLLISFVFIHTQPNLALSHFLFWAFAAARFAHSVVYALYPLPQPTRTILFLIGVVITIYMIFANFVFFMNPLVQPFMMKN
ncbi:microsomal glutathione S-transferase 1-like [Cloeon dipterum]|uniref:microsomal glutathione S-transferase 1-like n=1 Tax=Cloeon dipterum TaxID=197152 RepID=UPI00321F8C63